MAKKKKVEEKENIVSESPKMEVVPENEAPVDQLQEIPMNFLLIERKNNWCAEWKDGDKTYIGVDTTPLDSIIDLVRHIEYSNIKDEKDKLRFVKEMHLPNALSLAHSIVDVINDNHIGGKWFTAYELVVKTKSDLETINKQLEWLKTYYLVENDRSGDMAGRRWRIVSNRRLQMHILEKRKKEIEDSLEEINFQINKLSIPENVSLKAQEKFDELKS